MRDQVARLRRLSADLREAAAADEHALDLVMTDVDACEVAQAPSRRRAPLPGQGRRLDLASAPSAIGWCVGDSVRLQQVLANLLDNALRHTPAGGQVQVVVDRAGPSARIRVTDTGEGIPAGEVTTVFERFHRVDPSRVSSDGSGSGLGLTIARAIVNDHGGRLVAGSAGLGQGSTFTLTLPAS